MLQIALADSGKDQSLSVSVLYKNKLVIVDTTAAPALFIVGSLRSSLKYTDS